MESQRSKEKKLIHNNEQKQMVCDIGDKCGWGAALLSTIAFGSFAVPIKSPTCMKLQIDPLVFQTYKTIMNLITSFILLCILNQYDYHQSNINKKSLDNSIDTIASNLFQFSPWGIVSGLFWVPSGVAAVYAVQHAGLAVSQGVWSSFIVLVSFSWGFGIFGEKVYSTYITCIAIGLMIFGLWGMSFYSSSPSTCEATLAVLPNSEIVQNSLNSEEVFMQHVELSSSKNTNWNEKNELSTRLLLQTEYEQNICNPNNIHQQTNHDYEGNQNITNVSNNSRYDISLENNTEEIVFNQSNQSDIHSKTKGLLAASFNGLWGGSVMVPMHFASSTGTNTSGLNYVLSFAIGATIVTILLWICRFGFVFSSFMQCEYFHQHQKQSCSRLLSCLKLTDMDDNNQQQLPVDTENQHFHRQPILSKCKCAFQKIPSFHVKHMIVPGGLAGFMWSIGNIASMVSVDMLGEGIGYSVVQASMLISGLWGIFYFHEIQDGWNIIKWFLSAISTVCGIVILSYQHVQS